MPKNNINEEFIETENIEPQIDENEKSRRKVILDEMMGQFNDIENMQRNVNASNFSNKNRTNQMRQNLVRKLFEIMKQNGVDPSDLNSIRDFLSKLQKDNNDLYLLFEQAFNTILPAEDYTMSNVGGELPMKPSENMNISNEPTNEDLGLMSKFKNLGQNMLGQ